MKSQDPSQAKKIQAALALLVLTVIIVGALVAMPDKSDDAAVSEVTPKTTQTNTTPTAAAPVSNEGNPTAFKNGTYTATGSYDSPGGIEKFYLTVTLTNGKVTDTSAKSGSQEIISESYQKEFIKDYKAEIVGKDVSTIKLGNLSGSSLTALGFNDALKQIEQQAQG